MVTIKDGEIIVKRYAEKYGNYIAAKLLYNEMYKKYILVGISEIEIDSVGQKYMPALVEIADSGYDINNIIGILDEDPQVLVKKYKVPPKPKDLPKDEGPDISKNKEISIEKMKYYLDVLRKTEKLANPTIWSDEVLKFEIQDFVNTHNVFEPGLFVAYVHTKTYPPNDTPYIIWKARIMEYLKLDFKDQTVDWLDKKLSDYTYKVTLYEKIKQYMRDQILIKDHPETLVKESYEKACAEYPGINKELLMKLVVEITENGKKEFDMNILRYRLQEEIKKDPEKSKPTDDLRGVIYKGRVLDRTWLDRNGNVVLMLMGSAVFVAWYYRRAIIQRIMDYKIQHSIAGEFKFIPQSLDLSSQGGLSEIMKPSEQKQREELEIKHGGLFAKGGAKTSTSFDVGSGELKTTVETEDRRYQKLEGAEGRRRLKAINTKNILENNFIMGEKYKNAKEVSDKIKSVLEINEDDYYLTKVWEVLQNKNKPGIIQAIKNDLNKMAGEVQSGLQEAYEGVDIPEKVDVKNVLFGTGKDNLLIYENVDKVPIKLLTRDDFVERNYDYFKGLGVEKYAGAIKSKIDPNRQYFYKLTGQREDIPDLIVTALNDGLNDFSDISYEKVKLVDPQGNEKLMKISDLQQKKVLERGIILRDKEVEPPLPKDYQIYYNSFKDSKNGDFAFIILGEDEKISEGVLGKKYYRAGREKFVENNKLLQKDMAEKIQLEKDIQQLEQELKKYVLGEKKEVKEQKRLLRDQKVKRINEIDEEMKRLGAEIASYEKGMSFSAKDTKVELGKSIADEKIKETIEPKETEKSTPIAGENIQYIQDIQLKIDTNLATINSLDPNKPENIDIINQLNEENRLLGIKLKEKGGQIKIEPSAPPEQKVIAEKEQVKKDIPRHEQLEQLNKQLIKLYDEFPKLTAEQQKQQQIKIKELKDKMEEIKISQASVDIGGVDILLLNTQISINEIQKKLNELNPKDEKNIPLIKELTNKLEAEKKQKQLLANKKEELLKKDLPKKEIPEQEISKEEKIKNINQKINKFEKEIKDKKEELSKVEKEEPQNVAKINSLKEETKKLEEQNIVKINNMKEELKIVEQVKPKEKTEEVIQLENPEDPKIKQAVEYIKIKDKKIEALMKDKIEAFKDIVDKYIDVDEQMIPWIELFEKGKKFNLSTSGAKKVFIDMHNDILRIWREKVGKENSRNIFLILRYYLNYNPDKLDNFFKEVYPSYTRSSDYKSKESRILAVEQTLDTAKRKIEEFTKDPIGFL